MTGPPFALPLRVPPSLAQAVEGGGASSELPTSPAVGTAQPSDPLGTVGIALLAYGLVQLLSKVVDKLPLWKAGGHEGAAPAAGFTPDDRKRLERMFELMVSDHERMQRMQEEVREVHEYTRWASEQRNRVDARDGEPLWQCKARGMVEQTATNQRLIGQALDELRETNAKLDNVLRKLRALWVRVGNRRNDRK